MSRTTKTCILISSALHLPLAGFDQFLLVLVLVAPAFAIGALLAQLGLQVADLVKLTLKKFNVALELIHNVQVIDPILIAVNAANVGVCSALLTNFPLQQAVVHGVLHV